MHRESKTPWTLLSEGPGQEYAMNTDPDVGFGIHNTALKTFLSVMAKQ
jgi:hypothetical protein